MGSNASLINELIEQGYLRTPRIIAAFRAIDRKNFVRAEDQPRAYANTPLPIGFGQTISQPLTVAFMLELLDPQPGERILDVGSGSGWTTALLAAIVAAVGEPGQDALPHKKTGSVFALELIPELCAFGEKNIKKGLLIPASVAQFFCQDGYQGLARHAPFDRILASATSDALPQAWREQLKIGGTIVCPIGGSIWRFIKKSETEWEETEYPGFSFVPFVRGSARASNNDPQPQGSLNGKYKRYKEWIGRAVWIRRAVAIGAIVLLGFFAWAVYEIYLPHEKFEGVKSIQISEGLGSRKIGALLKYSGVIESKWAFVLYVSLREEASSLKPGVYTFRNEAIPEIARALVRGGFDEEAITIPEGWTIEDIAQDLAEKNIVSASAFRALAMHPKKELSSAFPFLQERKNTELEGYLFPDTYRIIRNTTPEKIITKMLENFARKAAPELGSQSAIQKKSSADIIIMASLIEKEVVAPRDRALVSGILWKRLEKRMPLQVDATVLYAKREKNPDAKRDTSVSLADLAIDSPYNTYRRQGLPAGPISNPGLAAIRAALHPEASYYWYYLSAPDGRTIFSQTLAEHNRAKAKYLR